MVACLQHSRVAAIDPRPFVLAGFQHVFPDHPHSGNLTRWRRTIDNVNAKGIVRLGPGRPAD